MTSAPRLVAILATIALGVGVAWLASGRARTAPVNDLCVPCSVQPAPVQPALLTFFQPDKKAPADPQRPYVGFRACLQCHDSGAKGKTILPGGIELDLMDEQWVLYKEFPIWAQKDKHGQAFAVLLNERSKTIGKLMGSAAVHRDPRCLACHTGYPQSQMVTHKDGLVDADLAKDLDVNLGVSCEGCHGASGDLKVDGKVVRAGWKDPHQVAPTMPYEKTKPWRFLSPEVKRDEYGFNDVRTPAAKAKLCASCHVGDVECGRVVTHEMYAAGHPPLPGFELETFVAQMPRHWAELTSKDPKVQEHFVKHTSDPLYQEKTYKKDSLHRTRSLLAGAAAAAGEYLRLTAQLADENVKGREWPELAVFDCYACHHELKSAGWRQARKPPLGVPGRPALQDWPFVLARIALKDDVDGKLADVRKALAGQPFGAGKDVAKSAQTAAAWFDAKALELQKRPVSTQEGTMLLKQIASVGAEEPLDYDSARQLAWAFQVIAGDLNSNDADAKKATTLVAEMDKKLLLLDLRSGRKAATAVPGDKKDRETIEVDLGVVLPLISSYDPAQFQARFKEIAALLK